jgi:hypothetical protein
MLLLQRLSVFLKKFNKTKVERRHSLPAKDGLQGASNAHKFIALKLVERQTVPTMKQLAKLTAKFKKTFEDNEELYDLAQQLTEQQKEGGGLWDQRNADKRHY